MVRMDIIVSGIGTTWTLQGNTDHGLEWLRRNAGLAVERFSVTLAATAAASLSAHAQEVGLLTGARTHY
jgi:hypothetical protein